MLLLKTLLLVAGCAFVAFAAASIIYHVALAIAAWRAHRAQPPEESASPFVFPAIPWRAKLRIAALAIPPLLVAQSIVVIPGGMAGVRISQWTGTRPGTLYPGAHFVWPFFETIALYDTRDKVLMTAADLKKGGDALTVQTREGLPVGLAVAVRYRLEPKQLAAIHNSLPQPIGDQLVAPVVASAFRDIAPEYMVRDIFAAKREEVRRRASDSITRKLGADGIVVKEVMLRDLVLPPEYVRGLEGIILKEQENEKLIFEVEIKQKLVRAAELEAEAEKARQVKHAEADAAQTVIKAKAEADAMQHTLPLKEKQIEQTRLEAEARKESTVKNAEAMAQAKVIDSRAELERGKLMAESDANRIRVLSAADAERLRVEAAALRDSPLLIQKIIAERLSDKVQILMVPADGKFFFNDVLKSGSMTAAAIHAGDVKP